MENYIIKQKPIFPLKTKANKIFSLKSRNKNERKTICTSITVNYISQLISQTWCIFIHVHLKFKNKLINFSFPLFKRSCIYRTYKDHDVISYLHHTVVTTEELASPPSHDSLPNFTVSKSRTVQNLQEQQVWIC